jgi:hypothetical protein
MGYAGAVQFVGFGLMPGANIIFADVDVYMPFSIAHTCVCCECRN